MTLNKATLSGLEAVVNNDSLYLLYFRSNIVGLQFKIFKHAGDRASARAAGEAHCKKMHYRLMRVTPLISDFAADELAESPVSHSNSAGITQTPSAA